MRLTFIKELRQINLKERESKSNIVDDLCSMLFNDYSFKLQLICDTFAVKWSFTFDLTVQGFRLVHY